MYEWMKNVRQVEPYVPGEQPKDSSVIKLNTNENPYPPSPKVINRKLELEKLRVYSDPEASKLVSALADYHGLDKSQVFVGVGSDDVLAMSFMTFFNSDRPILFPDITYSFYDVWAELLRIPYEKKALDESFSIVPEDYFGENGGIVFPNPNAPTCIYMPLDGVRKILDNNRDVVVIVDEAYIDYAGESALSLIDEYDNLLVVRTFSKSRSMAGLRIGYAMGDSELISALNNVKFSFNSYTMNYLQIELGVCSVEDDGYFREMIDKVKNTREWFCKELVRLGFSFPESATNFVFAAHDRVPAKDLFEAAKNEKIYLRYFNKPRIDNYLRITIGTDEEMKKLVEFFEKYILTY
ncbi:MAG: histidinol-phosphate transaminase [Lachnospiraceae bacterium]|nr:histidinol-phosphate transaminase [Lachnospiraceae bacterium]